MALKAPAGEMTIPAMAYSDLMAITGCLKHLPKKGNIYY
jgi:hypothetical protein